MPPCRGTVALSRGGVRAAAQCCPRCGSGRWPSVGEPFPGSSSQHGTAQGAQHLPPGRHPGAPSCPHPTTPELGLTALGQDRGAQPPLPPHPTGQPAVAVGQRGMGEQRRAGDAGKQSQWGTRREGEENTDTPIINRGSSRFALGEGAPAHHPARHDWQCLSPAWHKPQEEQRWRWGWSSRRGACPGSWALVGPRSGARGGEVGTGTVPGARSCTCLGTRRPVMPGRQEVQGPCRIASCPCQPGE